MIRNFVFEDTFLIKRHRFKKNSCATAPPLVSLCNMCFDYKPTLQLVAIFDIHQPFSELINVLCQ